MEITRIKEKNSLHTFKDSTAAGQVERLTSNKQGRQSVIVERIGYDKDGHTVYQKLGNGTETTYTYDKQRERLQVMNLTADGQTVMENRYRYDAVDNILGITNAANPTSLTKLNRAKLGGRSSYTYEYDELNRLIHASGKAKRASYDMVMSFGRMSEPLTKVQKVDSTTTAKSYNFAYKYEDNNHPTAPTQIGHDHYTYDANGNPTLVTNDSTNTTREMYWDEDNRLMVLSDNGKISRYTYNAAGERIMKSYGTMEGVYINGAPQGITFHETDNFTLYPASIISINKNRFTKHYFLGDKRVASRIGTGLFNNVYGRNGSYVTAGQQDYAERMNQIQKQKESYYKQQGIAPGVPTEKGAYGDPENTGVGYNAVLTELGNHDVPQGWVQTPKPNTTPNTNPGPPVSWNDPSNPDDPQAGYGYIPNDPTKEETFFYHSDHLGSTSYITDKDANITQFDAYLPYGELLVDEHTSSEEMPYKFNGKELDQETGLYYYGARYMNPIASIWYGVDALMEKHPNLGGYVYSTSNPIKFVDTNGKDWIRHNHTYMYDPMARSQEDVNKTHGDGWEYLFPSGRLFATNGSYSYDLTLEGDIKDSYTGEFIPGEFTTPYGSTLINNNQYLSQYEPSFMERWAQSDNFFSQVVYETVNDIYLTAQIFDFGNFAGSGSVNPLTGAEVQFYNMDGSPNYNPSTSIVTTLATQGTGGLGTMAKGTIGKKATSIMKNFNKLNAAQFSSSFNKVFAKFSPRTRGFLNRNYNKVIDWLNKPQRAVSVSKSTAGAVNGSEGENK